MKTRKQWIACILCASIFIIFAVSLAPAAEKASKVAVVPFKINAKDDYTFLRDGIVDMLTSRLSSEGTVTVVNREETLEAVTTLEGMLNESKAKEIGNLLGADFVLYGSMTVFGESFSIDAKMVDVKGDRPSLSFYNQTQNSGEVIPKIDEFASEINEKMFGLVSTVKAPPPPKTAVVEKKEYDVHAHPEKMISEIGKKNAEITPPPPKETPPRRMPPKKTTGMPRFEKPAEINPEFMTGQGTSADFWKSREFNDTLRGVAVGDTDGDGYMETVLLMPGEIDIYRFESDRFYTVKKIKEDRYCNFLGVDIADINGNGYPEIFVTNLHIHKNKIVSYVYEFDGSGYKKIIDDAPWYFRVTTLPGQGKILLGQKQMPTSPDPFADEIYEMSWSRSESEYVPNKPILPGGKANVLGVGIGSVMNDGQNYTVTYDRNDHIRVYDASGLSVWKSGEVLGGSNLFIKTPKKEFDEEFHYYYPLRLVVVDLNNDGSDEVVLARNKDLTGRIMERFRKYNRTQILCYSWLEDGLVVSWKTPEKQGYVSDLSMGDFDNDGVEELLATIVTKEGLIVGADKKSHMIAYELYQ